MPSCSFWRSPVAEYYRDAEDAVNVKTFGVVATLGTSAHVPDYVVYVITKELFDNFDYFKRQHTAYAGLTREGMLEGLSATLTVYSQNVDKIREAMNRLVELGKQGIAFVRQGYQAQTEFIFTKLNDIKPEMIEEATKNAREVAEKFARDSNSSLGKIKKANQGQFSIGNRDNNTPYIKKVRVVSTIEYYLSD